MRKYIMFMLFIGLLIPGVCFTQYVTKIIGVKDSIQSTILNEKREFIVSLPNEYETSNLTYPVLYLLDGSESSLLEAMMILDDLRSLMIIVALKNTDRDRDMMPLSTPSYKVANPGAKNFLSFIEDELIPHIEKGYRANAKRIIRGKSLSGLFVMYAFLEKPELFESFIGNSAGWYADMDSFFIGLADSAFKYKDLYRGKKLFVANSLIDSYDPKKEVHSAMLDFSQKIELELGDRIFFKYVTYDNYGHVPFPSFYDGMKYIIEVDKK